MNYRAKNIGIAVALAALAAILTSAYVVNYKRHVQRGEGKVTVLVAARDIPAGTSGADVVDQKMLKQQTVPRKAVVAGAISSPDQLAQYVATQDVFEGEQVSTRRFAPPTEQGIRAQIKGTQRAYELAGDPNQLLAGTLKEGDHIDVVGNWTVKVNGGSGDDHHIARVILRNILVMRAPIGGSSGAYIGYLDRRQVAERPASPHRRPGTEDVLDREERRLAPHASAARELGRQWQHDSGSRHHVLRRTRKEAVMSTATETTTRERVRVYATGSCEGFDKLRDSLGSHPEIELVGASNTVADGAAALAGGHLDVILHATRAASLPADELGAIREHTRAPVILLASGGSSGLLEQALDADVADVLLLPQLVENIVFAIRKATHGTRRHHEAGSGRHGRIVTVFSPKGGTGKTVTATNLAAACAKFEGRKTLLLDLDLQFGDAAIMLGIEPEKTIYDLVVAPGELDAEKLAGYTTKHACGLEVLPAPLRPEDAELVTEAKLGRLLEVAREAFDVIVVDTSPFFHGPMLATLDRTDELLLLCSLDVPTLKNLRLALQTLDLLSFPKQRVRIVLNRSNSKVGMKPNEVEGALGMKVRFEVPSDRAVPLSVNRGNPVVLAEEGADVSKAIKAMAKELFPAVKEEGKKRRLLPALARS